MDKKLKNNLIVVGFGVTLFVALYRLDAIGGALKSLFHIVEPVLAGCLIAFVLNVPMSKVDGWLHRLTRKARRQPSPAALQVVSLILTLALVIGIFVLLAFAAIPPLVSSVTEAATTIQTNIPNWQQKLQDLGIDAEWIDSAYNALRNKLQSSALSGGVEGIVNTAFSQISTALGKLFTGLIAFIISIYLLVGKKEVSAHSCALTRACLPDRAARRAARFWQMLSSTYADFFSGQCVEAIILGFLMFTTFSIMRLPYAGLVAVLTAVSSFIPYVGSFLACAVGALLILMINPMQALISIITYSVTQFCENQFIYPHVVGRAVGLPALWTLVAVLIGGKLGGILGMIFCIPLTSVFYTLIGEWVERRNRAKDAAEAPPAGDVPPAEPKTAP
jgi:predicted PurR-regulated permease PerM